MNMKEMLVGAIYALLSLSIVNGIPIDSSSANLLQGLELKHGLDKTPPELGDLSSVLNRFSNSTLIDNVDLRREFNACRINAEGENATSGFCQSFFESFETAVMGLDKYHRESELARFPDSVKELYQKRSELCKDAMGVEAWISGFDDSHREAKTHAAANRKCYCSMDTGVIGCIAAHSRQQSTVTEAIDVYHQHVTKNLKDHHHALHAFANGISQAHSAVFAGKQLNTDLELTNSEQAVCSSKFEVEAECKKFKGLGLVDILQHFAKVAKSGPDAMMGILADSSGQCSITVSLCDKFKLTLTISATPVITGQLDLVMTKLPKKVEAKLEKFGFPTTVKLATLAYNLMMGTLEAKVFLDLNFIVKASPITINVFVGTYRRQVHEPVEKLFNTDIGKAVASAYPDMKPLGQVNCFTIIVSFDLQAPGGIETLWSQDLFKHNTCTSSGMYICGPHVPALVCIHQTLSFAKYDAEARQDELDGRPREIKNLAVYMACVQDLMKTLKILGSKAMGMAQDICKKRQ